MIEMVAAQLLNQDDRPVYGAYLLGRMWFFVVLHGKEYVVHRGLNSTGPELTEIFGVLKNIKNIIDEIITNGG
ncbi:MAG: hypothetical protein AAF639_43955 [Chloroflexota bacterium]